MTGKPEVIERFSVVCQRRTPDFAGYSLQLDIVRSDFSKNCFEVRSRLTCQTRSYDLWSTVPYHTILPAQAYFIPGVKTEKVCDDVMFSSLQTRPSGRTIFAGVSFPLTAFLIGSILIRNSSPKLSRLRAPFNSHCNGVTPMSSQRSMVAAKMIHGGPPSLPFKICSSACRCSE